jgi:hypothetical protein
LSRLSLAKQHRAAGAAFVVSESQVIQVLKQQFMEYPADLARQKAQEQTIRAKIGQRQTTPIAAVVSDLYEKLDELRKLYGYDSIQQILDLTIDFKRRLDRMAELQGKVVLSAHELREYQVLEQQFRKYLANLAKQKAQSHDIRGEYEIAKSALRI